jgi:hypothetical protein
LTLILAKAQNKIRANCTALTEKLFLTIGESFDYIFITEIDDNELLMSQRQNK